MWSDAFFFVFSDSIECAVFRSDEDARIARLFANNFEAIGGGDFWRLVKIDTEVVAAVDAKYAHLEALFRRVKNGELDCSQIKVFGGVAQKSGTGTTASEGEGGETEIPLDTKMVDVADMIKGDFEFHVALLGDH